MKENYSDKFWFHIWNGLITEKKHETKLGISVWLYLWLLSKVDREKGEILITHKTIAKERKCSLSSLRWRLNVLKAQGYITTKDLGNCTRIKITKWRSINGKKLSWVEKKRKELEKENSDA